MKAVILLGTLKKDGLSNTATLSEFLAGRMIARSVETEIIKLVDHNILPGTYSDMGDGDEWPAILRKILDANIVIIATPVWWNNHSSETQKVIERLDELHDEILAGKPSRLEGKSGGIVITGDSDGAQQIIGGIGNYFNAVGLAFPPQATLSVLWEKQAKGKDTPKNELLEKYEKEYAPTAERMIDQMIRFAA
ncbi:MAG TPA: flavodoxin family protein [Pyrinomonadaceae bacterium]|nr:flavodoxin family protein [Pyrinomonadaceae bacterium]